MDYSVKDVLAVALGLSIFPLFVFVPGYVAATLLDLFRFRAQTPLIRCLIAVPLSISCMPILNFLLGRASFTALWVLYGVIWIQFAGILIVPRMPKPFGAPIRKGAWTFAILIAAGIAVLLCFSLIDLPIGRGISYGMSSYDYNFRAAVIDSITRRGLPPVNPFLHPGHDVSFRYHYFWFITCSLVSQMGFGAVSARQAQIAGTVWAAIGLCSLTALYSRFYDPQGSQQIRRRALTALILLAVSGLDILPVLAKPVINILTHRKIGLFGSTEWWNDDPVTSWTHALLWVPHHVCGLVACMTGFLILWMVEPGDPLRRRVAAWAGAGLAFASATGTSIHVTMVFACALVVWGAVALWRGWARRTVDLAVSGAIAACLGASYLLKVAAAPSTGSGPAGGSPSFTLPLVLAVRHLLPIEAILDARHASRALHEIVFLLVLPLNYGIEFGFFAVIAILFFARIGRTSQARWNEFDTATATIIATVLVVCTFVRSNVIANNDLGWRGILIAQFLLVIVATSYLLDLKPAHWKAVPSLAPTGMVLGPGARLLLIATFWLGLLPTAYELFTQRFHRVLMDAGAIAPDLWSEEETGSGFRAASLRYVYTQLDRLLPLNATVQHNPSAMQDMPSGLYANRQRVLMGSGDYTAFGGDPAEQERLRAPLLHLFSTDSTYAEAGQTCRALGIDAIVVKNNDPVWLNRHSWIWSEKPLVDAPGAKAFSCPSGKS